MGAVRSLVRLSNVLMTALYRLSGGRVERVCPRTPMLLLTVRGRNSGTPRTVPLAYFEHDGALLLVGSAGGSTAEPQWFRNLRAADWAVIERGRRTFRVAVRIADPPERDLLWTTVVVRRAPHFDGYAARTHRAIPIAVLTEVCAPAR